MITKEQYGLWKHEPVTQWFLSIIEAKRDRMKQYAVDQWLDGSDSFEKSRDVIRGQIIQLDELLSVSFDELKAFFEEEYGTESESSDG